jgi:hypothetical protein
MTVEDDRDNSPLATRHSPLATGSYRVFLISFLTYLILTCRINKSYVTKINSSYMMTVPSSRVHSLLWLEEAVVALMSNTMCHPLRRCQPRNYSTLFQWLLNEDVVIKPPRVDHLDVVERLTPSMKWKPRIHNAPLTCELGGSSRFNVNVAKLKP